MTQVEYDTWEKNIICWKTYEQDAKLDHNSGSSYVYLLLDPRKTRDIPKETDRLTLADRIKTWKTFLQSIFYIGVGTTNKNNLKYCRHVEHLKTPPKDNNKKPTKKASFSKQFFRTNEFSGSIEVLF